MDIAAWLSELGLERYAEAFRDNDIDARILHALSAEDLRELGVSSLGHRKKLLDAIARLRDADPTVGTGSSGKPQPRSAAERRQLSVMFVDLVGSTELAARLDPEDMADVIRAYHGCCAAAVGRWGGHVAKYMGDGVLAYFGWPAAHEDEAERAVRGGLAIVDALAGLETPAGKALAARVGIATGLVMVGELIGEGPAQEQTVVGETPNLAARLQTLAAPGSVVISQATRRLLGGLFALADLGPRRLKGFAEPLAAWRVEGEGRAEGRFEALRGEHLTPLVGREHELGILLERWIWAKDGEGQVVLLSGEAGIGKSRVVRALRERLGDEPHVAISHFCSPHHSNSALYPFIAQLERAAGLKAEDGSEMKLAKLEALLGQATSELDEAALVIAALLGIPAGKRYPALNLSPQRQKQRTLEVLLEQLAGLARQRPVLALYEDVHWVDPSSLELLDLLVERVRSLPVLVVLTFRPEFEPRWSDHGHITRLTMGRLGRKLGADLVARVTGAKPLPPEIVEQIVTRTDGVPLFVEELTKAMLESGLLTDAGDHYELSSPLPPLAIPTTLHDSLMARLDRLAPVKEVAQIGAVIGREFSHQLLAAVADRPESELRSALDQLVASELVFRRGAPPEATYSFKHALVQDAAYESLLKRRRRELHGRIAQTMAGRHPGIAKQRPEVLAHHFTEAEDLARAAQFWFEAGRQAQYRSATHEAIAHYSQALELIGKLPDQDAYAALELDCYLGLGPSIVLARGPRESNLSAYYARAAELSDRVGDDRKSYTVKWGKWYVEHFGTGEIEAAVRTADELVELGLRQNDRELLLQAHHSGWTSRLGQDLRSTLEHVENGIRLYVADEDKHQIGTYGGHDAGACCRWIGGMAYSIVGRLDRGAQLAAEAVTAAQYVEHEYSEVLARSFGASVQFLRRDEEKLLAWVEAMEAKLGDRMGLFLHFVTTPRMLKGWAQVKTGLVEAGLDLIESNLAAIRKSGFPRLGFQLHVFADAKRAAGDDEKAFRAIAEAFEICARTGERLWLPELHRIKAEILLGGNYMSTEEAEHGLNQALTIARKQGAMLFELRAATSLARLWAEQGERQKAYDLLAPVYGWFTEGFDTADLKDAKALLDALA